MKKFIVKSWGIIPSSVQRIIDSVTDKDVTKDAIFVLNEDIEFCVCVLRDAHGNMSKTDRSAWLSPRNGDNSFGVSITF